VIEATHSLVKNLCPLIGWDKLKVFLGFPFTAVDLDYALTPKAAEVLARSSHDGIGAGRHNLGYSRKPQPKENNDAR